MAVPVEVQGMAEFRRALRAMGPEWTRELTKVHRTVALKVAAGAQSRAASMGGVHRRAAPAIKGYANKMNARVGVSPGAKTRMANVALWGAKRHTGWYANARYSDGPAQHPAWVGNTWDVGVPGGGPYAINATVAAMTPTIIADFERMIDELARRAFPS